MRTRYDNQLQELNNLIERMGQQCIECLTFATQALLTEDIFSNNAQVMSSSAEASASSVHSLCENIIMRQQPVALDLRTVIAAQRIATDMARIAGQGAGIADMARKARLHPGDDCRSVAKMADNVIKMLSMAAQAFSKRDASLAKSVCQADDEVDTLFRDARSELVGMMAKGGETKERAENALDYMLIAKYLERCGDHTVGVANAVLSLIGEK